MVQHPTSLPPHQDAELIAACAAFQAAHTAETATLPLDEAEERARVNAFYATLGRVIDLAPQTPDGLRAKAAAARVALFDQAVDYTDAPWQEQVSPEERLALDVLQAVAREA